MSGRFCAALAASGKPCRMHPPRGSELCFAHDPALAGEAAAARRLGGLRRRREGTLTETYELGDIDTVDGQRRLLEIVIADTIALDNGVARNRTLIAAVTTAMKLRESTGIEVRLSALEAVIGARRERLTSDDGGGGLLEDPGP